MAGFENTNEFNETYQMGEVGPSRTEASTTGMEVEAQNPTQNPTQSNSPGSHRPPSLVYTQTQSVKRPLAWSDIVSLIVNKMVGTGIFTTPGFVLQATRSKSISMVLWAAGGVYSILCVLIYLEFGIEFPFNGAELIYLDRAYDTSRLPTWQTLLAPILFSGYFICLGHTAGNSIAFARMVLEAANGYNPDTESSDSEATQDKRLVNFIAISILTVVCLLHYRSRQFGLFLNRVLAMYKLILLLVVFGRGTAIRTKESTGDWGTQPPPSIHSSTRSLAFNRVSAFLWVLYSYAGWENANYVAGEIQVSENKTLLRRGALSAVIITTVSYLLAAAGFYLANTYTEITSTSTDIMVMEQFAKKAFGHTKAFKISICLSAFGNLVAVVFTNSKVKQMIAVQKFLPFSSLLFKSSKFQTPGGALALHWACSTIVILATPNNADGYAFVLGLLTYGQLIITMGVAIRLPWLVDFIIANDNPRDVYTPFVYNQRRAWILMVLVVGVNLLTIGCAPVPDQQIIPRYLWPTVVLGIFTASVIYWASLQALINYGESIGIKAEIKEVSGEEKAEVFRTSGVQDGTRWRVHWELTGFMKRAKSKIITFHKWMVDNIY